MTQKEVLQKLINLLIPELKAFGFKDQTKEQRFYRKEDGAFYFFTFLIYQRTIIKTGDKGFLIEPYVTIHVSEVEKYHKEITTNDELKKEKDSTTIGNSIANLLANPDGVNTKLNQSLDLHIFEEKHIAIVANELFKQFKNVALPYFLTNNTVQQVDNLLNKYPKEYCVHMDNNFYRFIKGIIAAKLNNNPQTEQLVKIYNDLIIERKMPDYCKEEMGRLRDILPIIENKKDS